MGAVRSRVSITLPGAQDSGQEGTRRGDRGGRTLLDSLGLVGLALGLDGVEVALFRHGSEPVGAGEAQET